MVYHYTSTGRALRAEGRHGPGAGLPDGATGYGGKGHNAREGETTMRPDGWADKRALRE